jgi:hypothetical protein
VNNASNHSMNVEESWPVPVLLMRWVRRQIQLISVVMVGDDCTMTWISMYIRQINNACKNFLPLNLWASSKPSRTLIRESADVTMTFEELPGTNYLRERLQFSLRQENYLNPRAVWMYTSHHKIWFQQSKHLKSCDFLLSGFLFLVLQINLFFVAKHII